MKIISMLLLVFIIVLSAVPSCDEEPCCGINSSEPHCAGEIIPESNNTCSDCSPFMMCGTCTGFVFSFEGVDVQPALNFIEKSNSPFRQSYPDTYITEFWNPPRIG